jgi:hypothetical protein
LTDSFAASADKTNLLSPAASSSIATPMSASASAGIASSSISSKLKVIALCACEWNAPEHDEEWQAENLDLHPVQVDCDEAPVTYAVVLDDLDPRAPRIAYASKTLANSGLRALCDFDDAALLRMFTPRHRRFI